MENIQFKKNNFDLIRLLAAMQVAIVHAYEHLGLESGRWIIELVSVFPGVPIFFVISGFLISASWERSYSLSSYIQNRVLRIYPALWACFAFSIFTLYLLYPINALSSDFFKWVIAQVSIGQFYNPDFLRGYGVGVLNGSLWTIPIELQFYLVLPLLYLFFRKFSWGAAFLLVVMFVLMVVNQVYIGLKGYEDGLAIKLFGVTVLPYLYIFMAGAILQRNFSLVRRYLAGKVVHWLVIYLFSAALFSYLGFNFKGNYLNPVSVILISILIISFAYSNTLKLSDVLRGNDISYGVYIYHMVFVNIAIHFNIFEPGVNFFLVLLLTMLMAFISWRLIEKPVLALKKYSARITSDKKSLQRIP